MNDTTNTTPATDADAAPVAPGTVPHPTAGTLGFTVTPDEPLTFPTKAAVAADATKTWQFLAASPKTVDADGRPKTVGTHAKKWADAYAADARLANCRGWFCVVTDGTDVTTARGCAFPLDTARAIARAEDAHKRGLVVTFWAHGNVDHVAPAPKADGTRTKKATVTSEQVAAVVAAYAAAPAGPVRDGIREAFPAHAAAFDAADAATADA